MREEGRSKTKDFVSGLFSPSRDRIKRGGYDSLFGLENLQTLSEIRWRKAVNLFTVIGPEQTVLILKLRNSCGQSILFLSKSVIVC
ncbi:hypothetical protein D9C11_02825 [Bacillus subtilis subsp. subtilis]|nr:hypothetical protein D9C11_02825 [Bacillus subtilis subsp. subtilis]